MKLKCSSFLFSVDFSFVDCTRILQLLIELLLFSRYVVCFYNAYVVCYKFIFRHNLTSGCARRINLHTSVQWYLHEKVHMLNVC